MCREIEAIKFQDLAKINEEFRKRFNCEELEIYYQYDPQAWVMSFENSGTEIRMYIPCKESFLPKEIMEEFLDRAYRNCYWMPSNNQHDLETLTQEIINKFY
jgi:hypothetical protein